MQINKNNFKISQCWFYLQDKKMSTYFQKRHTQERTCFTCPVRIHMTVCADWPGWEQLGAPRKYWEMDFWQEDSKDCSDEVRGIRPGTGTDLFTCNQPPLSPYPSVFPCLFLSELPLFACWPALMSRFEAGISEHKVSAEFVAVTTCSSINGFASVSP